MKEKWQWNLIQCINEISSLIFCRLHLDVSRIFFFKLSVVLLWVSDDFFFSHSLGWYFVRVEGSTWLRLWKFTLHDLNTFHVSGYIRLLNGCQKYSLSVYLQGLPLFFVSLVPTALNIFFTFVIVWLCVNIGWLGSKHQLYK